MKAKVILFLFALLLVTQVMQAKPVHPPYASTTALDGIWKLKEAYLNTTSIDSAVIQNVNYVFVTDQSQAYMFKADQGIQYNLLYVPTQNLVQLLNPSNGAVLFTYTISTLNASVLILTAKSVDATQPAGTHDLELRFVRATDIIIPVQQQQ